jgi:predicted nucleic acid-binding protein
MHAYADTSFLARIYTPHTDSTKALRWMQRARDAVPFTPLHLLHVGLARVLKATDFLTFDGRQAQLAKAVGFKVTP